MPVDLSDYDWLVSDAADPWLRAADESVVTPLAIDRLRRDLTPERAGLVANQWTLRRKARQKFSGADGLFFEAMALEQATDEIIATYKASTLSATDRIADLCCGIGGDGMSFARVTHVTAVESDPVRAILVRANLARQSGHDPDVWSGNALQFPLRDVDGWHIDPDRRPAGHRTTRCDAMSPTAQQMIECLSMNRHAMMKVAPASRLPDSWPSQEVEREWIGHSRQCQQQLWRFGRFARQPGKRVATILTRANPSEIYQVVEQAADPVRHVTLVEEYLIEPHAAIIAAGLADQYASRAELNGFPSRVAYYSSDRPHHDSASTCYHVIASMPFDLRSVRHWLRKHGAKVTTVKKRGIAQLDPAKIAKCLETGGERPMTLLVFPISRRAVAVLAEP